MVIDAVTDALFGKAFDRERKNRRIRDGSGAGSEANSCSASFSVQSRRRPPGARNLDATLFVTSSINAAAFARKMS